jgi:hypothetical protein
MDDKYAVDVRQLKREGLLAPGTAFTFAWDPSVPPVCRVRVRVEAEELLFDFDRQTTRVTLFRTPCHLGGARSWFACPNCGKRVARLFSPHFHCRSCVGRPYRTQSMTATQRAREKLRKLRVRLSGSWNPVDVLPLLPDPPKPRGMHWTTYRRLLAQVEKAELLALRALCIKLGMPQDDLAAVNKLLA